MYYKDKEVYTSSRGGKDYDTPTTYIRKNTFLNQFFSNITRSLWKTQRTSILCLWYSWWN